MGAAPQAYSVQQIFQTAIAQNKAVAVWRLPEAKEVQACVSLQENLKTGQPQLEQSPFGFLFCPFQESETHPNIFIKADVYFNSASGSLTFAADAPQTASDDFKGFLHSEAFSAGKWHAAALQPEKKHQTREGFQNAVEQAITAIREEKMEKVVLSRNDQENLPPSFLPLAAFDIIQKEYPRAFVSLVSVPGIGTWMGASPEVLVSVNQNQIFHTVALAGTQTAVENPADAIWRQKEIEEQAMVERYVLNCFKKLRLREYTEVGPRTIIAGSLMHLRTDFRVDMKEVDFPTLGTDMLALLHPTSAVCGLPKEPAIAFLLEHEGYDRSYYSGYLGPVNGATGTHLFVNLRCMELLPHSTVLYAGAGITGDSNPQKEWQETQHKMETMRRILRNFE